MQLRFRPNTACDYETRTILPRFLEVKKPKTDDVVPVKLELIALKLREPPGELNVMAGTRLPVVQSICGLLLPMLTRTNLLIPPDDYVLRTVLKLLPLLTSRALHFSPAVLLDSRHMHSLKRVDRQPLRKVGEIIFTAPAPSMDSVWVVRPIAQFNLLTVRRIPSAAVRAT